MALNFPNNPADGDIYQALGRGWKYNGTAGIWEALIRVNTAFDSDDIASGTVNLYQNPENIQDEVNNLLVAGTNITLTYDDVANTLTIDAAGGSGGSANFAGLTDTPSSYTGFAGNFVKVNSGATGLGFSTADTDDISEGTNKYYTDARVDTHLNQSTAGASEYLKWNGSDYEWATVPPGYTDSDVNTFLAGGTAGNIVTTGYIAGPATLTIDPAGVGDNTGTVVIAGNLQVDGTQTTINSTTLDVDDLNITIASGAVNAAAANSAGITVDGASATLTYTNADDRWNFNKELNVSTVHGNLTGDVTGNVTGDVTGTVSDISNHDTDSLSEGTTNLYFTAAKADARIGLASINNLSDVSTTGVNSGEVLKWNGSAWAPAVDSTTVATLGSIGNVNTTSVANNDILYYNNSANEWQVDNLAALSINNTFFDIFTASGSTNVFTMSQDPGGRSAIQVFVDGVPQLTNNYTTSGTTLTLGGTPTVGQIVEVKGYGIAASIGTPSDGTVTNAKLNLAYTSDQFTGDSTTVDYTIPLGHSVNSVLVILDGLILPPVDYSVSGTTLTFASAPLLDQSIDIRYMPI
jgi:hypothetical protein